MAKKKETKETFKQAIAALIRQHAHSLFDTYPRGGFTSQVDKLAEEIEALLQ